MPAAGESRPTAIGSAWGNLAYGPTLGLRQATGIQHFMYVRASSASPTGEPVLGRPHANLGARRHRELVHAVGQVPLGSRGRDDERFGDLTIGQSATDEASSLHLARGQRARWGAGYVSTQHVRGRFGERETLPRGQNLSGSSAESRAGGRQPLLQRRRDAVRHGSDERGRS